jgi:predicted lipoprotein with Yx(FWY)xxD motif
VAVQTADRSHPTIERDAGLRHQIDPPIEGASIMRSRFIAFVASATVAALALLAIAGCGSSNNNSSSNNSGNASTATPKTTTGRAATVGVASAGNLGRILVDSQGRTLYLFKKDSGTKSACFGACATAWPPLRASGNPTVGSGANASMIRTATRSDGKPQVVYDGHPLYLFSGDSNPGDTNGQGLNAFGGGWFVLSPAGTQISATSSTSGGGGGGY